MKGFSVIICTYNPDPNLLERLLKAILKFDAAEFSFEVILVDNGSTPAISQMSLLKNVLNLQSSMRLVLETEPGLTAARKKGIEVAKYDWLIFFDDDNEPASDYLSKTYKAILQYPQTGAWGAAIVDVEYIGVTDDWLEEVKPLFQQRNDKNTRFDCKPQWQSCYPFGTGLIIKRDIALVYIDRVNRKQYTLTDRKGKSLSSGGDVQMVFTCIEQGFAAGVIEELRIKHIISCSKTSLRYLQKQNYGTASAYVKAYNQVFAKRPIPVLPLTNKEVFFSVYSLFRIHFKNTDRKQLRLLLATKMGELNARVQAMNGKPPILLRIYERLIHAA